MQKKKTAFDILILIFLHNGNETPDLWVQVTCSEILKTPLEKLPPEILTFWQGIFVDNST
jgi:hypothetical protein